MQLIGREISRCPEAEPVTVGRWIFKRQVQPHHDFRYSVWEWAFEKWTVVATCKRCGARLKRVGVDDNELIRHGYPIKQIREQGYWESEEFIRQH